VSVGTYELGEFGGISFLILFLKLLCLIWFPVTSPSLDQGAEHLYAFTLVYNSQAKQPKVVKCVLTITSGIKKSWTAALVSCSLDVFEGNTLLTRREDPVALQEAQNSLA
jgi:hypothetical protein